MFYTLYPKIGEITSVEEGERGEGVDGEISKS
jgi:hypothetical protein